MKQLKGLKIQAGIFGLLGDIFSAKSNQKISRRQMDFQERMSSTAHQREVRDLQASGLNPILSGVGGAGSSSPGGAGIPAPNYGSTALSTKRLFQEMKNLSAQEDKTIAETDRTQAETRLTDLKSGAIGPVGTTGAAIVQSARGAANLWKNRKWLGRGPPSAISFPYIEDQQQPYSKIGFRKNTKPKYQR